LLLLLAAPAYPGAVWAIGFSRIWTNHVSGFPFKLLFALTVLFELVGASVRLMCKSSGWLELTKGLLDAVGGWRSDALIDGHRLPQAGDGLAAVAVQEVSLAGAFQGACLL
jgi:hypothetical protein